MKLSLFIANSTIDHLLDNVQRELLLKRVSTLLAPFSKGQSLESACQATVQALRDRDGE
jgi:hypothetical protein